MVSKALLQFHGHNHFRQRLILSLLSGKPVRISEIRPDFDSPGLTDYEASLLRLLEKITNGSTIEINHTGTALVFFPGLIIGGVVEHTCPMSRAIGYYAEVIIALAPFGKQPISIKFDGITNDNVDPSVDYIRTCLLPQLVRFGIQDAELKVTDINKILKRGAAPLGGGQIELKLRIVKQLTPTQFIDVGLVKRIRGIAYCTRMSPQMANRMVEAARGLLTRYIPDVYIYTDVYKGLESGNSPGYALTLVSETNTDVLIASECAYQPRKDSEEEMCSDLLVNDYMFPTPEDLGVRCARQLLVEIRKNGSCDSMSQWLNLLMIAMGPEDVGKVRFGSLTPFTYF